jgi:hypothetical protein
LGARIGDRGRHAGSEGAAAVEERRRPDRHSVCCPMRIGLHTDPLPDGQSRQSHRQIAVDVADPVRAQVRHQAGRLGNRHGPKELRVGLPGYDVDGVVVKPLSRVVLVFTW